MEEGRKLIELGSIFIFVLGTATTKETYKLRENLMQASEKIQNRIRKKMEAKLSIFSLLY